MDIRHNYITWLVVSAVLFIVFTTGMSIATIEAQSPSNVTSDNLINATTDEIKVHNLFGMVLDIITNILNIWGQMLGLLPSWISIPLTAMLLILTVYYIATIFGGVGG